MGSGQGPKHELIWFINPPWSIADQDSCNPGKTNTSCCQPARAGSFYLLKTWIYHLVTKALCECVCRPSSSCWAVGYWRASTSDQQKMSSIKGPSSSNMQPMTDWRAWQLPAVITVSLMDLAKLVFPLLTCISVCLLCSSSFLLLGDDLDRKPQLLWQSLHSANQDAASCSTWARATLLFCCLGWTDDDSVFKWSQLKNNY